jgi:hypothetical protein
MDALAGFCERAARRQPTRRAARSKNMAARTTGTEALAGMAIASAFLPREEGLEAAGRSSRAKRPGCKTLRLRFIPNPSPEAISLSGLCESLSSGRKQRFCVQPGQAEMYVPVVFTQQSPHILWETQRAITRCGASIAVIAVELTYAAIAELDHLSAVLADSKICLTFRLGNRLIRALDRLLRCLSGRGELCVAIARRSR